MKPSLKVFIGNMVIFLIYTVIMSVQPRPDAGAWCAILVLHLAATLILMIVFFASKKKNLGLATLLSFFLVLLVGFGTCASLGKMDFK